MAATSPNHTLTFPVIGGKAMEPSDNGSIPQSPTAQLTRKLVLGDESAFREFHASYFDRLYRFTLSVVRGAEHEAEEALQLTFIRVARYIRVFESEEVFWGWLKAVARSAARDSLRKRRRYAALLERFALRLGLFPGNVDAVEEDGMGTLLAEGLDSLPPSDRRLLEAKYTQGFSVREIALETGLTEKAVESRLLRLRRALRNKLLNKLPNK